RSPRTRDTFGRVRSAPAAASGLAVLLLCANAAGADPAPQNVLPPDVRVDIAATPPEGRTTEGRLEDARGPEDGTLSTAELAPPVRPRHRGLVLETEAGALGFVGQFRHLAPTAFWLHAQLGYELANWLMLFGESELAFTDTSESEDQTHVRAFPIWGLGGGARVTIHASARVGVLVQGELGGMSADVPHDALTILGYRNAESFQPYVGARVGVELLQIDRHFTVIAHVGMRDATGFAKFTQSDLPLMWDGGAGLSYTF
ncbi:MAG TPA: hypothetical protein VKU41_30260, partial [Polyangiaceae bacterium]|nr:hypothetical protein [Polyangiaceae bacterium]